ncbi:alpha/beta hydrolase [Psychroflexus sp. YR1-1]|uniref:Alpha/beta hydrolase n=1 Tax=Psychroflexus aurantiacus TaxID=2709310 RepID=A0A6B3QZ05_9FLAO|nr:alpha/beta hydrolase [Psychroflexus aurantiacus]NEV93533.1 alpha/beta hydrolase [Psychroflexus aurantiacus]
MKVIYISLLIVLCSISSHAQDISGDWTGELKFEGYTLDLNFKIYKKEGDYASLLSVPAQSLNDYKSTSTSLTDSIVRIELQPLGIKYQGTWSAKDTIVGEFFQNGMLLKLNLIRGQSQLNRPQEPQPPFAYEVEEVVFRNEADSINLSGTLTLPKTGGPFPVVILISGSGPQDRNSTIMGHKPFLLLADELTQSGVGVLRFDERGVGQSEGDFKQASLDDFVKDVTYAFDFLKNRPEIDSSQIGLLGHSIGGIIAPRVAIEKNVSFLILLASPGIRGDELMLKQRADFLKLRGIDEAQIEESNAIFKATYEFINTTSAVGKPLKTEIMRFLATQYAEELMDKQRAVLVDQISSNEFIGLLRNRPAQYLEKVDCPVLAIGGSKDFQVSSTENLEAIQLKVSQGGNTRVETREFEGLNHLLQESDTGDVSEYAALEQTMSPRVLDYIKTWLTKTLDK